MHEKHMFFSVYDICSPQRGHEEFVFIVDNVFVAVHG